MTKLEEAVRDIERWEGCAYQTDDEVGLAVQAIKEVIKENRSGKVTEISGKISDVITNDSKKKEVFAKIDDMGVYVGAKGYSTMCGENDEIVLLEQHNGKLRLVVWSDINSEDPTHVIDLSKAKNNCRKED